MLLRKRFLILYTAKRITVEEALAHPYLANLHDPAEEPVATTPFNFDFEQREFTREVCLLLFVVLKPFVIGVQAIDLQRVHIFPLIKNHTTHHTPLPNNTPTQQDEQQQTGNSGLVWAYKQVLLH